MIYRKGQVPPQAIIGAIFAVIILSMLLPALTETFNSISCQREKSQNTNLQNSLTECQNQLASEIQKSNSATAGLDKCREDTSKCNEDLQNCLNSYADLKKECDAKEQPITEYYFIKVFNSKIILFEWLILYNIHLFGLFLSFGMTFTIKLFEVDVHIHILNKKNQRKVVKAIKEYLAEHPYMPIVIVIIAIILTNLPQLF